MVWPAFLVQVVELSSISFVCGVSGVSLREMVGLAGLSHAALNGIFGSLATE